MTTPLTKLIEENKERPIAEAPRDGRDLLFYSPDYGGKHFIDWLTFDGELGVRDAIPTHFRPLPDDRLARVTEALVHSYHYAMQILEKGKEDRIAKHGEAPAELLWALSELNLALERVTAIAEGKE